MTEQIPRLIWPPPGYVPTRLERLSFLFKRRLFRTLNPLLSPANLTTRESIEVVEVDLPIAGLPAALDGFTIAQISDLHLGPSVRTSFLERATQQTADLHPDLIAVTGDLVYRFYEADLESLRRVLAPLRAPCGVFVSMGNHDIPNNPTALAALIDSMPGLTLLVNRSARVTRGDAALYIAGVDTYRGGQPDLAAAVSDIPADATTVLLAHEPDTARDHLRDPRVRVQLSGHSHGGQVILPLIGAPMLPIQGRKYWRGLYAVGDGWVYTNSGLGTVGLNVRYNCPPEITLLRLVTAV